MIALPRTRGFSAGHRQIFLTNNNRINGQAAVTQVHARHRFIFCRRWKAKACHNLFKNLTAPQCSLTY
jgi:hypothetical protein